MGSNKQRNEKKKILLIYCIAIIVNNCISTQFHVRLKGLYTSIFIYLFTSKKKIPIQIAIDNSFSQEIERVRESQSMCVQLILYPPAKLYSKFKMNLTENEIFMSHSNKIKK